MHNLEYFHYEHLPEPLQEVSKHFSELAHKVNEWPSNDPQQRDLALTLLLQAKDAAVRAML